MGLAGLPKGFFLKTLFGFWLAGLVFLLWELLAFACLSFGVFAFVFMNVSRVDFDCLDLELFGVLALGRSAVCTC